MDSKRTHLFKNVIIVKIKDRLDMGGRRGRGGMCLSTRSCEVPSSSMTVLWVRDMCTPISLWIPQHSRQIFTPRLRDNHSGSRAKTQRVIFQKCMYIISLNLCQLIQKLFTLFKIIYLLWNNICHIMNIMTMFPH